MQKHFIVWTACLQCLWGIVTTTAAAQQDGSQPKLNRAYIDDDDQRQLADLKFSVDQKTGRSLRISIAATGPNVEPIGGYRGIHGSNRYTAEELDLVLRGLHESKVITRTEQGDLVEGRIVAGEYGHLTERRVTANGQIDFRHQTIRLPLSIHVDTNSYSNQWLQTTLIIDGQPRLACRYRIANGKIVDLETQSLGHDGYIALDGPHSEKRNRWVTATAREVKAPVEAADWAKRDIEGKWVLMIAQLDETPKRISVWVEWLAQEKEFELLEWLAMSYPDAFKSHKVGEVLMKADAPQWIRVAAWHRNAQPQVGHARQHATQILLEASPAVVEHWLQVNRNEIDNWAPVIEELYRRLQSDEVAPKDSSRYAKPFNAEQRFRILSNTPQVVDFADRLTAEEGVVYEHQVLRAIKGVIISGRRTQKLRDQLTDLVDHSNSRIRIEALLAHSFLLPGTQEIRPIRLMEIVDDQKEPDAVRQAALLGVSYQRHPILTLKLHSVATDVTHPAWKAAVSRLGDIGKGYSILILDSIPKGKLSHQQQQLLQDSIVRIAKRESGTETSAYFLAQQMLLSSVAKAQKDPQTDLIEIWVQEKVQQANAVTIENLANKFPFHRLLEVNPIWELNSATPWSTYYTEMLDEFTIRP